MPEQGDAPSPWPRRWLAAAVCVYAILVPWVYVTRVHPIFDYMGFSYNRPGMGWMVIGVTLAAIPGALLLPLTFDRPSQFILAIVYLVVYVPSQTIPFLALPEPDAYLSMAVAMLLCFVLVAYFTWRPPLSLPRPAVTGANLDKAMLGVALAGSAWIVTQLGFRGLPALLEVYSVRSEYMDMLEASSPLLSYVINWLAHVVYAYFFARGLHYRKTWMWMLGIAGNLYVYSFTGFKSVLFSMAMILLVVLLFRRRTQLTLRLVVALVVSILAFGAIDDLVGGYVATGVFTQRVIMVPGLLTGYYFDFFSTNPLLLLSHSIFKSFLTYPYAAPYPSLISEYYLNMEGFANANYLADAFGNFGIPGMFAFSLLLGLLLWLLDSLCEGMDVEYTASFSIVAFFTLTNSALLTGMLTFGILFLLLVLWLHPPTEQELQSEEGA